MLEPSQGEVLSSHRLARLQSASLCSLWAKPTWSIAVRGSGARIALWRACSSFRSGRRSLSSRSKTSKASYAYDACTLAQQASSPFGGVSSTGMFGAQVRVVGVLSCSNCSAISVCESTATIALITHRRSLHLGRRRRLLEHRRWRLEPPALLG